MELNIGDIKNLMTPVVHASAKPEKRVYLVIPCYGHKMDIRVFQSLRGSMHECSIAGIQLDIQFRPGDALVHKARNVLAAEFLMGDYTHIFMVDDDICWGPNTIVKMINHPVDFVAAPYRIKAPEENYFVRGLGHPGPPRFERDPVTRLVEIKSIPTGFMRCSRAVFEKIISTMDPDKDWFKDHAAPHCGKMWTFFDFSFDDNVLWGEDYIFCKKYRDAGGRIWIDPDVVLTHIGLGTYTGNFAAHMDAYMAHQKIKPEHELKVMVDEGSVARRQAAMGEQILETVRRNLGVPI